MGGNRRHRIAGRLHASGLHDAPRAYPLALTDEDAFVKKLVRRASIMHNEEADPQMAYMITKNFVHWYSAGCALKYMRHHNIRVLSVSPRYVETPMTEKERGKATDMRPQGHG